MNTNKGLLYILLLLPVIFLLCSCSDKDDDKGKGAKDTDNQSINEWIYDELKEYYFWNDKMTSSTNLNFNEAPDIFFYKSLFRYNQKDGDRFSYLEKDGIPQFYEVQSNSKVSHNDLGFEFQAYRDNDSDASPVQICVTYMKKGSEAEKQTTLKRGDWITSIDGTHLTRKNFYSLALSGKSSLKLGLSDGRTINLPATGEYYENPIYMEKIIKQGNKKIGYIIYNSFANGKDKESKEYAFEINEILTSYEGKIDELILDLRYNGGGLVESGTYIASAIAPNRSGNIYTKRNYNANLEKQQSYRNTKLNYFRDEIKDGSKTQSIPKLEMKRLYVITSNNTASASEQIINGLSPYTRVEIVGETTTGKNMESFDIEDKKNKENKWILHPLTSVSYNSTANDPSQNDYSGGFKPTIGGELSEISFHRGLNNQAIPYPIEQLGELNETLLATVLNHIKGVSSLRKAQINTIKVESAGSSLDRKRKEMIIEAAE